MFSNQALSETTDIYEDIDYLFEFIQGDITHCNRQSWASSEVIERGKKSLMVRSEYKIITDKEEYWFYIIDYSIDTINSYNAGLYMLEVMTWEDSDRLLYDVSWQERLTAGVSFYGHDRETTGE